MTKKEKTKAQLLEELERMRQDLAQANGRIEELEAAMQESRENHRALLESINEVLYSLNTNGLITYISPSVKPMAGYDPAEMIGRPLWDFVYQEDLPRMKKQFERLKSKGRRQGGEYRVLEKTAGLRWARISERPVFAERRVIGSKGVMTDVTKRKWAEERLHLLSEAVRQSSEGISLSDLDEHLMFVNEAFAELHGYDPEELIGKHISIFHTPDQMPAVEKAMQQVRKTGRFAGEIYRIRRDGTSFPGLMHNSLLRGTSGRPIGVMSLLLDISDLKKAEEALRENQADLERRVEERTAELVKAKEELTSELKRRQETMSHLVTYRNRLRSLTSELALTEERERRRIATYLHDKIGHELAMARIRLENLRDGMDSTPVAASMDEISAMVKSAIQEVRSLTFELSPPVLHELGFEQAVDWLAERFHKTNSISCTLECDHQRKPLSEDVSIFVFQSVRELLVNIVKHAKASNAKIRIKREGDQIIIKVKDDGVGFDPSKLGSHLQEKGGYGLFSIRERFESVGGKVMIESRPGSGCCVTLLAPLDSSA
ncbi:MAG: PAS domain-containing sensor histidine kinase [Proteobacteria bacterium]|nr:PAS domain-containing sensor histidine kinase [Pseudomonadota bacterium]